MGKKLPQNERNPRYTELMLDMGRPEVLIGYSVGANGSIKLRCANGEKIPIESYLSTSYERKKSSKKGPKIINRIRVSPKNLNVNQNTVLTRYNWIVAVDTNKPINKWPHAFFTGILILKIISQNNEVFELGIVTEKVVETYNLKAPSERFGWLTVCQSIGGISSTDLVGVIVDAHLNNIPAINRREEPILGDFYLPDGFELIYASSNKSDNLANKLIKQCDWDCQVVAQHVAKTKKSSLKPFMKPLPGDPFTHIRYWDVSWDSKMNNAKLV